MDEEASVCLDNVGGERTRDPDIEDGRSTSVVYPPTEEDEKQQDYINRGELQATREISQQEQDRSFAAAGSPSVSSSMSASVLVRPLMFREPVETGLRIKKKNYIYIFQIKEFRRRRPH